MGATVAPSSTATGVTDDSLANLQAQIDSLRSAAKDLDGQAPNPVTDVAKAESVSFTELNQTQLKVAMALSSISFVLSEPKCDNGCCFGLATVVNFVRSHLSVKTRGYELLIMDYCLTDWNPRLCFVESPQVDIGSHKIYAECFVHLSTQNVQCMAFWAGYSKGELTKLSDQKLSHQKPMVGRDVLSWPREPFKTSICNSILGNRKAETTGAVQFAPLRRRASGLSHLDRAGVLAETRTSGPCCISS
jgi:hypothetical protein